MLGSMDGHSGQGLHINWCLTAEFYSQTVVWLTMEWPQAESTLAQLFGVQLPL